jgi:hypothetical protein
MLKGVEAVLPLVLVAVTMQPVVVPAVPSAGAPLILLVDELSARPAGNTQPDSASVGAGVPMTVRGKLPTVPMVNTVFAGAEIVGALEEPAAKLAVTEMLVLSVMAQTPVPLQAPLQPVN